MMLAAAEPVTELFIGLRARLSTFRKTKVDAGLLLAKMGSPAYGGDAAPTEGFEVDEGGERPMSLLASVALLALGVIVLLGVDGSLGGLDATAIGVILMVVGAIGALVSLVFALSSSPSAGETEDEDRFTTIPR